MGSYVLHFKEIDKKNLMTVGGKGLNLGELTNIESIQVPAGFCITTEAYIKSTESNAALEILLDELAKLKADNREQISKLSKQIRSVIEKISIDKDIKNEINTALSLYEKHEPYAVRSSATAEDLPTASFAGQHDTYLNVRGKNEVLRYVVKCWASLFTDRAVTYRIQNGFDHRKVFLSVIVQKMILSDVSGTMFTADPMTSDRKTVSLDASFGLGEALVFGLVNPDTYKIRDGNIVTKRIGSKTMEILPAEDGGTK